MLHSMDDEKRNRNVGGHTNARRDNQIILFKKACRDIKFSPCKNLSNNTEMLHDHDGPHQSLYSEKIKVNSRINKFYIKPLL